MLNELVRFGKFFDDPALFFRRSNPNRFFNGGYFFKVDTSSPFYIKKETGIETVSRLMKDISHLLLRQLSASSDRVYPLLLPQAGHVALFHTASPFADLVD